MRAVLTIDATEPLELAEKLRNQKAAQTAADRTARKVRTSMTRAVRLRMGLLARDVRDRIDLSPTRINPVSVTFSVNAEPVPLIKFKARQLKRAGTRAKIGGSFKTFKGAFIARDSRGNERVFRRKKHTRSRRGMPWGSPELPIRQMYGPSVADIYGDEWEQHGLDVFRENFDEQLFRALRFGRGRRRRR